MKDKIDEVSYVNDAGDVVIDPGNNILKINEMYAFVSVDEGGEGVVGMTVRMYGKEVFMPFVCADKARVESLRPKAFEISKMSGKSIKLLKFSTREVLEEIIAGQASTILT